MKKPNIFLLLLFLFPFFSAQTISFEKLEISTDEEWCLDEENQVVIEALDIEDKLVVLDNIDLIYDDSNVSTAGVFKSGDFYEVSFILSNITQDVFNLTIFANQGGKEINENLMIKIVDCDKSSLGISSSLDSYLSENWHLIAVGFLIILSIIITFMIISVSRKES